MISTELGPALLTASATYDVMMTSAATSPTLERGKTSDRAATLAHCPLPKESSSPGIVLIAICVSVVRHFLRLTHSARHASIREPQQAL
ncbi:hypothetical protein [Paraburkholderia phytofirmans]|jgi:hypothetical protein|uniref:Uncharacterized protein n=1 Tax=Paraburkholderia phytofirmans OLGA172 TaxID=1417228 RepID=A0A160FUA2_9BURK|nr:hypothetical protein [Paraburkholderia phytofirmans]ANB76820.1 hypothetical protein AYM40_32190 [Paraburkholderia phytofirmans OLGA172]